MTSNDFVVQSFFKTNTGEKKMPLFLTFMFVEQAFNYTVFWRQNLFMILCKWRTLQWRYIDKEHFFAYVL